jgi:hypothetical protein
MIDLDFGGGMSVAGSFHWADTELRGSIDAEESVGKTANSSYESR